jgi:hypothetical protein
MPLRVLDQYHSPVSHSVWFRWSGTGDDAETGSVDFASTLEKGDVWIDKNTQD